MVSSRTVPLFSDYVFCFNIMSIICLTLYCVCEQKIVLEAALMSTVYEEQKDEDGFLYVQYSGEATFGGMRD